MTSSAATARKVTAAQRKALEAAATVGPGWSRGVNGNTFNALVLNGLVERENGVGNYVISAAGRAAIA